MEEREDID